MVRLQQRSKHSCSALVDSYELNYDDRLAEFISKVERRKGVLVSFGTIEIHEFPPAIGDNPAVSDGAPITLDVKPIRSSTLPVDEYERYRRKHPRRPLENLSIPRHKREEILRKSGYRQEEIADAIRRSRKVRLDRETSIMNSRWDGFNEKLEMTSRRIKKLIGLRRSSKTMHPACYANQRSVDLSVELHSSPEPSEELKASDEAVAQAS